MGLLPWSLAVAGLLMVGASGMEAHFELPADPQPHHFPVGRLLLEGTTLAVTGLAIAAVIAKFWDDEPGKLAAPTLLALYAASWALPEQWGLWARPSDLWWTTTRPWCGRRCCWELWSRSSSAGTAAVVGRPAFGDQTILESGSTER